MLKYKGFEIVKECQLCSFRRATTHGGGPVGCDQCELGGVNYDLVKHIEIVNNYEFRIKELQHEINKQNQFIVDFIKEKNG